MSAIPYPSQTNYLRVPDTATKKKDQLKGFSVEEVAKHNKPDDLWIIVDSAVYDLSKFVDMHPGGGHVLVQVAGQDATEAFFGLHRSEVLKKYGRYIIGTIEGQKPRYILPTAGALSPVPYAEPTWIREGFKSPYYKDSHRALQKAVREFTDEHVVPDAQLHEKDGKRPTVELIQKMGEIHMNAMRLGPGKLLHGLTLPGGVKGEEFDYFHEQIVTQELVRGGARGYADGLQGGMVIGLPPVMNFGSEALKKEIIPEVLAGRKWICLAITEAFAGSDVAGLRTTAVKTPDGKHYIVNGTKKWITNGNFSDYFSVGVNTGNGLSMLLIPRQEGVETKLIKTSYSTTAGTAYVTFDNVKVPAENLLGKEGKGIFVILSNFNHERWVMCCGSVAGSRMIVEECFKWAHQRKAFGKPLIELAVIRAKLAAMFQKVEAAQAYLENITFQMCNMSYAQQADALAGPIGLLKTFCTRCAGDIVDDAVQIFGGRAITQGGMGGLIEMAQRSQKFDALLGGAEEVLADLGVRQASRKMPKAVLLYHSFPISQVSSSLVVPPPPFIGFTLFAIFSFRLFGCFFQGFHSFAVSSLPSTRFKTQSKNNSVPFSQLLVSWVREEEKATITAWRGSFGQGCAPQAHLDGLASILSRVCRTESKQAPTNPSNFLTFRKIRAKNFHFALFVVRASSILYRQMDRKRSPRELPEGSPSTRRMRLDCQTDFATPFLPFPSPPPRTSSALSDPVRPTTIFEGLEDSNDFNFDPLAFLESLRDSPIPPSSTSYTRPQTYQADYESLPTDFQVLGNPYLATMPSPPLVPGQERLAGIGGETGSYTQPLNQEPSFGYPSTSTTSYSTPALSPERISLSSSQDHGIATTPAASFPSPQVYLSPQPASLGIPPYDTMAIDDGEGLGLQQMNFEPAAGTGEYKPKQPLVATPAHSTAQTPTGRPKRPPPPDVPRKGVDIGLSLADFDMLDTLGTGTFGKVLLARLRTSPSRPSQNQPLYFAMKVLEKNTIVRLRQVEHVNSERSTLALIQHPFIVNLFCTFQDEQNLYLLLEYVQGGELFSHLRRAVRFSADVTRFYIANLVLALEHLHQQDIIYRDLKPENLLIGADGHIKVTDFGFAKYVPDRTWTLCGTPEYLAPEIITATGHGAAADWWALGILLFELLAGYPPFFADNPLEIYEKILTGKFSVPHHIDPVAKDLIRRLLTADLTKRLGNLNGAAHDVKMHRWFEGVDWEAVKRKEIRAPIVPLTHIPGDSSNFERFPVADPTTMPGIFRAMSERKYGFSAPIGPDTYGYLFPNF